MLKNKTIIEYYSECNGTKDSTDIFSELSACDFAEYYYRQKTKSRPRKRGRKVTSEMVKKVLRNGYRDNVTDEISDFFKDVLSDDEIINILINIEYNNGYAPLNRVTAICDELAAFSGEFCVLNHECTSNEIKHRLFNFFGLNGHNRNKERLIEAIDNFFY